MTKLALSLTFALAALSACKTEEPAKPPADRTSKAPPAAAEAQAAPTAVSKATDPAAVAAQLEKYALASATGASDMAQFAVGAAKSANAACEQYANDVAPHAAKVREAHTKYSEEMNGVGPDFAGTIRRFAQVLRDFAAGLRTVKVAGDLNPVHDEIVGAFDDMADAFFEAAAEMADRDTRQTVPRSTRMGEAANERLNAAYTKLNALCKD